MEWIIMNALVLFYTVSITMHSKIIKFENGIHVEYSDNKIKLCIYEFTNSW